MVGNTTVTFFIFFHTATITATADFSIIFRLSGTEFFLFQVVLPDIIQKSFVLQDIYKNFRKNRFSKFDFEIQNFNTYKIF